MRLLQGVVAGCLCLIVLIAGCRRNQPTLVDTNEAPETELWYAPPDSSEYQYLVHIYWRGTDNDGTVEKYIWTIQDSLNVGETSWNPAQRLRDLRSGHVTTATDSIFAFTAFKNIAGVGIRKNRQAFYMASIDDNGVIDPSPAAVEFIATIDKLPTIDFTVHINGQPNPYSADRPSLADTVGMYRPFQISFHGQTVNGLKKDPDTGEIIDDGIRAYTWFPLSTSITLPGSGMWRPWTPCSGITDPGEKASCEERALQDTLITLRNRDEDVIPSSTFRFAAQCRDDADAESHIDAGRYQEGVCQVVVNFDPDTEIDQVKSTYWVDDVKYERDIDFADATPDTVPYLSWLWIHYAAWDDSRDSTLCSPVNSDHCIDFQLSYQRTSARLPGSGGGSGWVPRGATHDTDTTSAADSNTVNIGTVEYVFLVRGIDENAKADGTPARVAIVGNYDPTLDGVTLEDQFGNQLDLATTDTLTWNFWKGVGWPYTSITDTIDFLRPGTPFKKTFRWRLRATGHDSSFDPTGSGVKAWRYLVFDEEGNFWPLLRAGETWVTNDGLNNLDDTYEITWRYGHFHTSNDTIPTYGEYGDAVMDNLPGFLNRDLTFMLRGRDTAVEEPDFKQYMFLGIVPAGQKGVHNFADKILLNTYPTAVFGRWTQEKVFTFHWRMIRDPAPPSTR